MTALPELPPLLLAAAEAPAGEGFQITYLQIFLTVCLPIMGFVYALLGGIKLSLAERLQLDEGKVGRLVGAFGTMFGPTIVLCGFLTDSLGREGVWLAGSAAVVLAVFMFSTVRSFGTAAAAVLLLGAGWAAQVNVGNVLMRQSVPKEHQLAAVNFYDFVFGFGAFLTPLVLGWLLGRLQYRKSLLLLAGIAALPLVLGVFADMKPADGSAPSEQATAPAETPEAPAKSGLRALLTNELFWVIGLAFLFYVPLETSVAGWATTLVLGQTPPDVPAERARTIATRGLSGFWLGFTGSRLIVAVLGGSGILGKLLGANTEQHLLLILSGACLALMLWISLLKGRGAILAAIILSGLAFGPVFPTMMTLVFKTVPGDTVGRAVGFFFFCASVGWTFIPAQIGRVARKTGKIQRGFLVAAASSAVFVALVLLRGEMVPPA